VIKLKFHIVNIETADSTNDYLKKLVSEGGKPGTVVIAETQTSGRGRQGKSFFSPPGGVYMSVYYDFKKMAPDSLSLVTPTIAVCVAEAIEEAANVGVTIKWVNDIYYEGKKICGILTEKLEKGFIVGIGINLSDEGMPEELKSTAGFIKADRKLLISLLTETLDLNAGSFGDKSYLSVYRAKSYLTGKNVSFIRNGVTLAGTALDIDERYRLKVKTENEIMTLDCGEVSVRAV
jgi:BirA family biotin operon repressor/biotin-[acetyl-CoA-carboxylase] ligase